MSLFFFVLGCASAFACGYYGTDAWFFNREGFVPEMLDRKKAIVATVGYGALAVISAVIFTALR